LEDGRVYFSAGFLPGNEIYACAADARTGRLQWRTPLGKTSIIPCGHLVLTPRAVLYPSPGSAAIYHPVFLSRADGSRQGGGNTHGDFTDCRFVPGCASDGAGYSDGFVLHGGSAGILRGYRAGVGYSGRPLLYPGNYDMYPLPAVAPGEKPADHPPFADGGSFPPLFAGANVGFRQKEALVCVARTNIAACVRTKLQKGDERDRLLTWRAAGLPCGEPEWLLAATGDRDGDAAVFVAGGTNGVTAMAGADGRVLWNAAWTGATRPAAIAGGCLFASSPDGRVRALKPGGRGGE
jgi:outer membrane protein assembly factor BamB